MILVVEGTDCAGKGTICSLLADALGALLYKTPPECMRAEQDTVNATASDIDHYDYFVRVVRQASEEIAAAARERNIVVDRYWMTTVAYHRAMGLPARFEDIGDIVMPDRTVYLTVSPEVQDRRMAHRGMSPGDIRMRDKQRLIRAEYEEVIAGRSDVIRVDTSNITPEEIIKLILGELHL
jgi:thymidylate kinase